jgi:hypothetical protein
MPKPSRAPFWNIKMSRSKGFSPVIIVIKGKIYSITAARKQM